MIRLTIPAHIATLAAHGVVTVAIVAGVAVIAWTADEAVTA